MTFKTDQLTVTMDSYLPRPLTVIYHPLKGGAVNFTANARNPKRALRHISSIGSAPSCLKLKPPFCECKGGAGNTRNCSCAKSGTCTNSSSTTCQVCDFPSPPTPHAPTPAPPPSPPPALNSSIACITVIAFNGNTTEFCAADGETVTVYSAVNSTSAAWLATLTKASVRGVGTVTVTLAGTVSIADVAGVAKSSQLSWTLEAANSTGSVDLPVRAIDLGYGFVG